MAKDTTTDPVSELKAIQARQAAQKIQFETEQRAAQARVEVLNKLQHPLIVLIGAWREKFIQIKKIKMLIASFTADTDKLRQQLHDELVRGRGIDYRAGLVEMHKSLFHTEAVITECAHSVEVIQNEMGKIFVEASEYADRNNLKALLSGFKEPEDW